MRVAIIGFGLAGEVFHAPLLAAVDGLDVAVVVTTNPERAERARALLAGVRVVDSVDEAWDVDLAVIATPNRHHAPLALEAIRRGVPVVVDKPLATNAAEADEVVRAADEAGVMLTVFQNRRWDGDFMTARRLIADGTLGDVIRFESRFERFRPEIKQGWRELGDPAEGGGQLLDLGSHLVDQARCLFGHPRRVYAEVERRRPRVQVDDDVFIALEHTGHVRSHLWMGSVAPLHGPRLGVSGLRGGFEVDGLDPQEPQLAGGVGPADDRYGVREVPGRLVLPSNGGRPVPIERGAYQEFYEAIARGETPVDPHDSVAVLRVLEAARRSAETKEVVEL
jgi:predicted dehydrogenase